MAAYTSLVQKKHILSISYDEPLLITRQLILEAAGYSVTSAVGFVAAMEFCTARHDFDLVLMGHSIPQKDQKALITALRPKCPAPVLSILRRGESPMPESDYSIDALDGPEVLLQAVKEALEVK